VPEPLLEDLQDQVFEEPSCSSRINKASLLEHVAPVVISLSIL
jgi:hypothetical protein